MKIVDCGSCKQGFLYRAKYGNSCPICGGMIKSPMPEDFKESLVEKARDQAKVINNFGQVLQVIGYVLIAIFSISLLFFTSSSNLIAVSVCLAAILVTFASFNVFGSALRAIALYIQVKVE